MSSGQPLPLSVRVVSASARFSLALVQHVSSILTDTRVSFSAGNSSLVLSADSEHCLILALEKLRVQIPDLSSGAFEVTYLRARDRLEPYVRVEVSAPDDHVGDVLKELSRRGGLIESMSKIPTGNKVVVRAPLAVMLGFDGSLDTLTFGVGRAVHHFIGYEASGDGGPDEPSRDRRA